MEEKEIAIQSSSFRDNHGHVFVFKDEIYRCIKLSYKRQYDHFINSGLYHELVNENCLVKHIDVTHEFPAVAEDTYKIIKPKKIPCISYPTEWCFSQIKDAALTTLRVQQVALKYGMILKDSSGFNVQFYKGRAIFIDTISFDFFNSGTPWMPYKQFCEHFLGPLYLVSLVDPKMIQLFNIDGISLSLSSKLLPSFTTNFSLLLHIHLHAHAQQRFKSEKLTKQSRKIFTKAYLSRLTQSLIDAVHGTQFKIKTTWGEYYKTSVENEYLTSKRELINALINTISPATLLDLGANNGEFSRVAASKGIFTIAADSDHASIESNYQKNKELGEECLLPLIIDIANPTPAFGLANGERASFLNRIAPDVVLMLAVIHHLTISSGIPFCKIAEMMSKLGENLIIEFVPKNDSKVRILLQNREDVFHNYTKEEFEKEFCKYFILIGCFSMSGTDRIIYHFRAKLK